jgi:hypothetical protein
VAGKSYISGNQYQEVISFGKKTYDSAGEREKGRGARKSESGEQQRCDRYGESELRLSTSPLH